MMQPQPMIVVRDIQACSQWFQDVLGLSSGHGGDEYEMLMDGITMVAQLHRWEAHEHPHLGDESSPSRGNGVLLWFATGNSSSPSSLGGLTNHRRPTSLGPPRRSRFAGARIGIPLRQAKPG
jgi:hypothetical protein